MDKICICYAYFYCKLYLQNCVLQLSSFSKSAFRPPEDCSMCARVTEVVRLANTTAEEFEKYAYSTTPVIVTDATDNWKALKVRPWYSIEMWLLST